MHCLLMVLIETIRNLIRPVRLAANIISGHLLLILLPGLRDVMTIIHVITFSSMISPIVINLGLSLDLV